MLALIRANRINGFLIRKSQVQILPGVLDFIRVSDISASLKSGSKGAFSGSLWSVYGQLGKLLLAPEGFKNPPDYGSYFVRVPASLICP